MLILFLWDYDHCAFPDDIASGTKINEFQGGIGYEGTYAVYECDEGYELSTQHFAFSCRDIAVNGLPTCKGNSFQRSVSKPMCEHQTKEWFFILLLLNTNSPSSHQYICLRKS